VLGGHSAVIWLEGISGCYLLSRCRPLAAMERTETAEATAKEAA
jgi:hypothetical protein